MVINNQENIFAAFEKLLEEIEIEVELTNKTVTSATEKRDYDSARKAIEYAAQATEFREKIASLRKGWEALTIQQRDTIQEENQSTTPTRSHRLRRGIRTPENAYYQPILKALNELGGAAKQKTVIDKVGQLMKEVLKPVDYESLPSTATLRWRNVAAWARNNMVQEGLLRNNSPHGIWEMSEKGRVFLMKWNK